MKKYLSVILVVVLSFAMFGCGGESKNYENGEVYVYNWGEYIDPECIDLFEDEYHIKVIYDMFETNEEMYPQIERGSVSYDCICPSEYMIEKMKDNDLLLELDFGKIPEYKNISKDSISYLSVAGTDKYAIPYMGGSVGILYNKTLLDEKGLPYPESWADLWKDEYKGEILMQNSVRDAYMVALKKNGFSMNSTSDKELEMATYDLIEQKPLVQAYVVDQVRDKMVSGEAMIGVIYSGEVLYVSHENEDYEYKYVIPTEGTNVWYDAWVIPKNSKNVENAYKWLDFMCRPDVAKMNCEFITYESPNEEALKIIDDEYILDDSIVINNSSNDKNEIFRYLGEAEELYNEKWKRLKSK